MGIIFAEEKQKPTILEVEMTRVMYLVTILVSPGYCPGFRANRQGCAGHCVLNSTHGDRVANKPSHGFGNTGRSSRKTNSSSVQKLVPTVPPLGPWLITRTG